MISSRYFSLLQPILLTCLETCLAESMHLLQSPAMRCNLPTPKADVPFEVWASCFPPPWSDEPKSNYLS
jgi:hypothetical protein